VEEQPPPQAVGGQPPSKPKEPPAVASLPGERKPEGRRREHPGEVKTKPEHVLDKSGSSGQQVQLYTNYFRVKRRPNTAMYQYHVDFNPPIDSKALRKALIREKEAIVGKIRAFDGMVLFLPRRLADDPTEFVSRLKDGTDVNVTIKCTGELAPDDPTCLRLINILFRRVLEKIDLQEIGRMRNYYNPKQSIVIEDYSIELWPGFVTSIARFEQDVMLCAEVSHKILRTDTVLNTLYDLHSSVRGGNYHNVATRKLLGSIVMTRYNNKTYRIDDIDWRRNPTATFETRKGTTSFIDYYRDAYNIDIKDREQPLLVSMPKKRDQRRGMEGPILLIPELCYCTGLSDDMRSDFKMMKAISGYTHMDPRGKKETLEGFVRQIGTNPEANQIMNDWNLEFDKNLVQLNSRLLNPENIFQASPERSYSYRSENTDWTKEMRGAPLKLPVALNDFLLVFTRNDAQKADEFFKTLRKVGGPMGMQVGNPTIVELPDDRTETYVSALKSRIHPKLQMAIVILPRNTKDRYDAIKKVCCLEKPVPSQCILSRTLSKNMMSVTTKIALQLNCKLGGELWAVDIPIKNTMVIGIDTYHDTAQKGRSAVGFCASMNNTLTRYYCQSFFQAPGQELASSLRQVVGAALEQYKSVNKTLPDRIFVYRDGVGEGQLQQVFEFEVAQFRESFAASSPGYNPKFTFIVVTKRINTRFMAAMGRQVGNPLAGTIVDSVVTKQQWYDFFLVSQSVRQGTVAPSHFNVIWDSSGLKPDHIQRLSYKLCHLYYNWPGTIRVPAPCQYAHKLAYLIGESMHKDPSLDLANRLYFL
jgi:aubergine-like protein